MNYLEGRTESVYLFEIIKWEMTNIVWSNVSIFPVSLMWVRFYRFRINGGLHRDMGIGALAWRSTRYAEMDYITRFVCTLNQTSLILPPGARAFSVRHCLSVRQ